MTEVARWVGELNRYVELDLHIKHKALPSASEHFKHWSLEWQ